MRFVPLLCLWLALLSEGQLVSQPIEYFVEGNPMPSPYISDWEFSQQYQLFADNFSTQQQEVVITINLYDEAGELVGTSQPNTALSVLLQPGFNNVELPNIFSPEVFLFFDPFARSVRTTGRLPGGEYELCFEFHDVVSGNLIGQPSCYFFFIQYVEPPVLIYPPNGVALSIDELPNTLFQWSPVELGQGSTGLAYRFVMVRVLPGQAPQEAFLANPPEVEELIFFEPVFQWPENLLSLPDGQQYAWSVQIVSVGTDEAVTEFPEPKMITVTYSNDTTITRDTTYVPDPEEDPRDSLPPTVPPPPEYPRPNACSDPTFVPLPETPISLGMQVENNNIFPYPRAVPIRAEAIDWDLVEFTCTGCGDPSKKYEAVRDRINQFEWKLVSGKGSLNKTFEVSKMDSLLRRNEEIRARMEEIDDSLAYIDDAVDSLIPGQIKELEEALEKVEKRIKTVDSLISEETRRKDSLQVVVEAKTDSIAQLSGKVDSNATEIEKWQGKIDSFNTLLENNPTQKERNQQAKLREIREEIEGKEEALEHAVALRDTTSSQLQDEIKSTRQAMDQQAENYYRLQQQADSMRMAIGQLERQLFEDPAIRAVLMERRNWLMKANRFNAVYTLAQGTLIREIGQSSLRVFLTADSTMRHDRFQVFQSQMQQWNGSLGTACGGLSGENLTNCHSHLGDVQSAGNTFYQTVQVQMDAGARIDPEILAALDTLRQALTQLEGLVQSAKNRVDQASVTYQQAIRNFNNTIAQMEEQISDLRHHLDTTRNRFAREQNKYQDMVQARQDSFEVNKPEYLEEIAGHEHTIMELQQNIQVLNDSILDFVSDTAELNLQILEKKLAIEELEEERANLERIRENIKKEIDRLKEERDDLEDRKPELEAEREDLVDELLANEEALEELSDPNKDATGPMVYYIPPPLEEVMKDKPKFDSLKRKIARAEIKLQQALANKQAVQSRVAAVIDKTARNLVKYRDLKKQIEDWKQEKSTLSDEAKKEKTKKQQEYLNDQQAIQNEYRKELTGKSEIEEEIRKLEQDSIKLRGLLDEAEEQMAAMDSLLQGLKDEMKDASAQLDYEQQQFRNASNTLNTQRDRLVEKRNELEEKEKQESKLKNQAARAEATEDPQTLQTARSQLDNIQQEINTIKNTAIPGLEGQVSSAANSVASARLRVDNAQTTFDTLRNRIMRKKDELENELRDTFIARSDRYETVIKSLTYWRKRLIKQEQEIEEVKDRRKAYQDSVSAWLNRDEGIRAKNDQVKALEEKIKSGERELKGIERDINAASGEADEVVKAANDTLKTTRQRLKDAHREMRDFLLDEFNHVKFTVKIKLTVRNENPLDQFRAPDDKEEFTGTLEYTGNINREPKLTGKNATANIPQRNDVPGDCVFTRKFIKDPAPPDSKIQQKDPKTDEPRTIALIYRDGRKLWPEWPVIGDTVPLISKDVVRIVSAFTDTDQIEENCDAPERCTPGAAGSSIREPGLIKLWDPKKGEIRNKYPYYQEAMWEPAKIDTPKPREKMIVENYFQANELGADQDKKGKGDFMVEPGTMLETTEDFKGVPDTSYEVQTRIVTGDHKGLEGERIKFEVTLIAGEAEDYQFEESGDTVVTVHTKDLGYAKAKFKTGKGYARFKFTVTWFRGGTPMDTKTFELETPLSIQVVRFSKSAPSEAWSRALKIVTGDGGDVAAMADEIPEDAESGIHAIAGLYNFDRDFVKREKVTFEISDPAFALEPETDSTKAFGLARTMIMDSIPDDADVRVMASIDEPYEPVGDPARDEKSYSTESVKQFKIGSSESMFVVILEEEISPEDEISGKGTLTLDVGTPTGILAKLIGEKVSINKVKVKKEGETYLATAGNIALTPATPYSATMRGFTVELDSFVVPAEIGAGIGGTINHTSLETPVRYYAELDHHGNFYGEVRNLPEITVSKFKLRQGAHIILDMHDKKNPDEFGSTEFHGVMVRTADLEMPNLFSRGQGDPAVLNVRNTYVGSSGFGGTITFNGPLFKMGYGTFGLEAKSFTLTFEDNTLTQGEISGAVSLPVPMEGTVSTTISYTGTMWKADISTDDPVSIPRLGLTMTLLDQTTITYDENTDIATVNINAHMVAKRFKEPFTITNFKLTSEGEISAESIDINQTFQFSGGFKVSVTTIGFELTQEEYSLSVAGSFSFPSIGLDDLEGEISIAPGPSIDVALTGGEIRKKYGPVFLEGSFSYTGREFKGEINTVIDPVLKNGLKATIIVGNTEDPQEVTFTYWYIELVIPAKIPLGQSGFMVSNFGGGVGYNYDPPVGEAAGSPNHNESFSVKAILGIQDQSGGNLFASESELVLTSAYLTLYSRAWVLDKRKSMYGEGQLNCYWESDTVLDGHLGMLVGLPDAEGGIFKFEGRINFFLKNDKSFRVWSQTIEGHVLSKLTASAQFDISMDSTVMDGNIRLYASGKTGLLFFDLLYMYDIGANGHFGYYNQAQSLDATMKLYGAFSLDAENSVWGKANLASGKAHLLVEFSANPSQARIYAEGNVEYDVWLWEGEEDFEIEYITQL